jgi:hypothetical protein
MEPTSIRAGDLVTWTRSLSDYPADQGWTLAYTLINASAKITITASASGADHVVSVAAATTAGYATGNYRWIARVTKSTEIYTVDEGSLTIFPNLAALTTYDGRTWDETMLEAIKAAMQGTATATQLSYEINGRRVEHMSVKDRIEWLSFFEMRVAQQANGGKRKLIKVGLHQRV